MSAPLCVECKHFRRDRDFTAMMFFPVLGWLAAYWLNKEARRFGKCLRAPKNLNPINLIDGRKPREFYFCSVEREFGCGPTGKNFERKS